MPWSCSATEGCAHRYSRLGDGTEHKNRGLSLFSRAPPWAAAADPVQEQAPGAWWPGADRRQPLEESAQVLRQLLCAPVPEARILLQAPEADRLQVPWNVSSVERRGSWAFSRDLLQGLQVGVRQEGRPAHQALVEDDSQAVDIARDGGGSPPAGSLLRRQVVERAHP